MTLMGFDFIFEGTCGSLTALMGVRFLSSWKILPAGLMAGARQGYFFIHSKIFIKKDFPDIHNKTKKIYIYNINICYLGIIDINMDKCIVLVVELCFALCLCSFVDVPEDWCESATEFTKEETMTSFRNSTCRSCGDAQID